MHGHDERMLIIDGHPEPDSLTAALAASYQRGAGGTLLCLRDLRFDPILRREQALEPDLAEARALISASDHVAWLFPTWWAGPPALLKAFIERAFTPGYAYQHVAGQALHQRLLRGRSARMVTTMDAPWWWYSAVYQRALHAAFVNATLRYVGFSVRSTTLYGVRGRTRAQLSSAIERLRVVGERDAMAVASRRSNRPARPRLPSAAADRTRPPSTSPY
jgi:putative NADPH-quinone reductase